MDIANIIAAIQANRVRVTDHADEEADADKLKLDEIYFSVLYGEVIEDYPTDKPYPSCLIYGRTLDDEPVHSVWAFNDQKQWAVLITVYRPDPNRWINWRERRKNLWHQSKNVQFAEESWWKKLWKKFFGGVSTPLF
jgi:hypothetical protein